MKPETPPTPGENEPPPGGNPKGLMIGIGLMLVVLMLYGLGRPREPEVAEKAPEPPPVEIKEEKKPKGVMGLMMADPEEIERERKEVLKAEAADLVVRQKKILEDFASYNVGSRFLGDAVMSEGGARNEVRATVVAKSGSVLEGTALLVVKAETYDHRYVNELVAKYPEPIRSRGSRRKYERYKAANLSPKLRFAKVTSPGVPKRKGPQFFSSDSFSVGFTRDGSLGGSASTRYGRGGSTSFTLRPADALVADTPVQQWEKALAVGARWRGRCEQFKRMGYNEVPLSAAITIAVAAGRDDDERLLVVSREDDLKADRSVVRLKRGDPRSIGGWHWVGARETPSLVVANKSGGINFLIDRKADTGVPVAARLTDTGKLALRFGPIGSAILSREGFTATESAESVARRIRETLVKDASYDGTVTIPPEHYEGDRREAKPVVLRARLVVTQASGAGWRFRLEVPGQFAHTAEFRGELVDDRFERVRFPLRLVRTSLTGGRKSTRRGVCLLSQDAEKSPVLWLRIDEVDGVTRLVGRTPSPNNESLVFTPAVQRTDQTELVAKTASIRNSDETRSERMLTAARQYLRSSKPAVVKKGQERLAMLIEKYPKSNAAAEAKRLLKGRTL